eukprot:9548651-Lingulodinium_polyedra.AAC.1
MAAAESRRPQWPPASSRRRPRPTISSRTRNRPPCLRRSGGRSPSRAERARRPWSPQGTRPQRTR